LLEVQGRHGGDAEVNGGCCMNLVAMRRQCDHAGSGDGPCGRCGASMQRKWLEAASGWAAVARDVSLRAMECATRASDAAAMAAAREEWLATLTYHADLRETCALIAGFDYYRLRDRLDRGRARLAGLRAVRERLERPRGVESPERGTFGARCEEAAQ
jgi:hypothetical protein